MEITGETKIKDLIHKDYELGLIILSGFDKLEINFNKKRMENWVHTAKADQRESAINTLKKAKIMEKEKEKLELLKSFIEKLKQAANVGLTQSKIAEQLGISTNTISRYKNEKGQMNTDTYENIINLINSKL